jgi:catechol 2,3-dioxygenase-like lactoylglutathione lyase family enzyme
VINAMHLMFFSKDADADRAFLRDVLGWPYVDAGSPEHEWLIFRAPAAEAGFHASDGPPTTEVYLMCDDLAATVAELAAKGVRTSEPSEQRWGITTSIQLPSGGELGLYQPKHATAHQLDPQA